MSAASLIWACLQVAAFIFVILALSALCFAGWELINMATYKWRMKRRVRQEDKH